MRYYSLKELRDLTGSEYFAPELKNQNFGKYKVCTEIPISIAISFFILD